MMLPARALAYAIIVSVFVAILSLSLIQFTELSRFLRTEQIEQERMLRNLNSGINIIMSENHDIPQKTIDLFGEQKDSIQIAKYKWGLFNVGLVQAFVNNIVLKDTIQKAFLIGVENPKLLDFALCYTYNQSVLTVSGSTLIIGDVALSKAGIKSDNIAGSGYTRSKPFYGKQFLSDGNTSSINKSYIEEINKIYNTTIPISKNISKYNNRAFTEKTLLIEGDSLYLDNCEIIGNIVIKSKKGITIGRSCRIKDAIIIAPKIYIKSGFQGELQAFAYEQIITEPDVNCYYPSILSLIENNDPFIKTTNSNIIKLDKNTLLEGLLFVGTETFKTRKTYISIENNATVKGLVYIQKNGTLELKGKVFGTVVTSSFYRATANSLYENVIIDGTIDRTQLSSHYISPTFLENDKKMAVLKWVD